MKYRDFAKQFQKKVFNLQEAERVAWQTSRQTLRLQLHQWCRSGDLVRLKKGVYTFADDIPDTAEIIRILYPPAYISLETALHYHGFLPDVPFATTLISPRTSRRIHTPVGRFEIHHIKTTLFWGYDPDTLLAEREKALVDYCYLYSGRLLSKPDFWEEGRWQNLGDMNFKKAEEYAKRFDVKKVVNLIQSLGAYGKTQKNNR